MAGAESQRLYDLVCDLPVAERRARLVAEKADARTILEVEMMLAEAATQAQLASPDGAAPARSETEVGEGDSLGAWRLLRRVAKGGMGAVYLAERADGHFQQEAAVKLIRGLPNEETLAHFARERQILATLQHPHIARLLDGGATPGGQPYLVMEYVEGEPIDAYCARNQLDLDARLALFREVCGAVQFAHQRLIVHCDLKPSNVLVRMDGTPVLLDFGIARALDRQHIPDIFPASYFTPGYASPEQLRGGDVSTASDVYALGLVLFELVAERKARLDAEDRTITLLGRAAVRPSQLADSVPWRHRIAGDIDAIVLRATASDPAARYASAEALSADVKRFLEHRTVLARPQTPGYRLSRLLRRRWPAAAVGALIVLLIAAFTWRLAAERDRALAAERDARVQATTAGRVSDFLVSVFNVSNPKFNHNRDITAREVLDQGATRIDGELGDQPRVKAKLMNTLATAYRFIGQSKQSAELFQRAIDLYLDPRVNEPLDAAAALSQLAVVYSNNSYPPSASEGAARRSLELREKNGADALAIGDSWNTLGVVLESEDKFKESEAALQKGLALRRSAGADELSIAASLHNLGMATSHESNIDRSVAYFAEALAAKRKAVGDKHPDYQITLQTYAVALGRAGRSAEALPLLEQNLAICREIYGDDSDHTGSAHNEIGSVLHDLGRFREASEHYRESMRLEVATIGADSPEYAKPLNNLASAYEDMGDYASAIPLFRQSLAIRAKTLAGDSPMVLRADYNLARVLTRANELREAKPFLDTTLAGMRARYGDNDANTVKAELWLGEWQLRSGDVRAAGESLARVQASKASLNALAVAARATFAADVALAKHDAAAALESRREAWQTLLAANGENHPLTVEKAGAYAAALADAGRGEEAKTLITPLLPVFDAFAPESPARRSVARWLQ